MCRHCADGQRLSYGAHDVETPYVKPYTVSRSSHVERGHKVRACVAEEEAHSVALTAQQRLVRQRAFTAVKGDLARLLR